MIRILSRNIFTQKIEVANCEEQDFQRQGISIVKLSVSLTVMCRDF